MQKVQKVKHKTEAESLFGDFFSTFLILHVFLLLPVVRPHDISTNENKFDNHTDMKLYLICMET